MTAPLFQIEGLVAGYRPDLPILHGISLRVDRGEMVTIIGPNGAGKSTLIKAVAGLVPVTSGSVTLDGRDITGLATHRMAEARIAYVPQTSNVFTTLSVRENLRLGALHLGRAEAGRRMTDAYARFPALYDHRSRKAGVLSGGQRQMLAVARALLTVPDLLMLDEPSAGLAPRLVAEVFAHLAELAASGITLLIVEQNVKAALAISDRTYVFAEGENRIDGVSAKLAADPQIGAIYFGTARRRDHASGPR